MRAVRAAVAAIGLLFAPVAASSLTGCAAIEAMQPKSARQSLALAEITLTGAITTTQSLLEQGAITKAEASAYSARLKQVGVGLDSASIFVNTGDLSSADAQLALTIAVLDAIVADLTARLQQSQGVVHGT